MSGDGLGGGPQLRDANGHGAQVETKHLKDARSRYISCIYKWYMRYICQYMQFDLITTAIVLEYIKTE